MLLFYPLNFLKKILRLLLGVQRLVTLLFLLPFIVFFYSLDRLGFHYIALSFFKGIVRLLSYISGYQFYTKQCLKGKVLILTDHSFVQQLVWARTDYKTLLLQTHSVFDGFYFKRFLFRMGFIPTPKILTQKTVFKALKYLEDYENNNFNMIQFHTPSLSRLPALVYHCYQQNKELKIYKLESSKPLAKTSSFFPSKLFFKEVEIIKPHKRLALYIESIRNVLKENESQDTKKFDI